MLGLGDSEDTQSEDDVFLLWIIESCCLALIISSGHLRTDRESKDVQSKILAASSKMKAATNNL